MTGAGDTLSTSLISDFNENASINHASVGFPYEKFHSLLCFLSLSNHRERPSSKFDHVLKASSILGHGVQR
jgi:hypothetical protein